MRYLLLLILLCGCTYNNVNVPGSDNKIDCRITAPKEVTTDVSGSGYGNVR